MNDARILLSIAVMSLVTILLRFLPFFFFSKGEVPSFVRYLGEVLPYASMGMLVIYCFKDAVMDLSALIPSLIGALAVILIQAKKKNTLLSILCGSIIYLLLVNFIF